jgi:uncharacterized protein
MILPGARHPSRFEAICSAMGEPSFYPHPVSGIEVRETHISVVFLTGTWVYKLKKPVDFGFLDFSSLRNRELFCKKEVVLNRRLSTGVYVGVVPIRLSEHGRFTLAEEGETVEFAVKMRQLPEATGLAVLLKKGKVGFDRLQEIGKNLAVFYGQSAEADKYGSREIISFNLEENFSQLSPFGRLIDRERLEFMKQSTRFYLLENGALFDLRVKNGRIRDGHGDLRAEHVYFFRGIQIIDCIEFNERFRFGDVASDLAFLHMDIERLADSESSLVLLRSYAADSGDPGVFAVLDFYAGYRALVRLKVACLRQDEAGAAEKRSLRSEIARLQRMAYRYILQGVRPTLWVFFGLPATGKSVLAEGLADSHALEVIQSDRVRRETGFRSPEKEEDYGEGAYRIEMRGRVYADMFLSAQKILRSGKSVVLDATFSLRKWRREAVCLARDVNAFTVFVECVCSGETIRKRLGARLSGETISDARLRHLPGLSAEFEPVVESEGLKHFKVDTESPFAESLLEAISRGYATKRAQARELADYWEGNA